MNRPKAFSLLTKKDVIESVLNHTSGLAGTQIAFLSESGNDATGQVGNPLRPYRSWNNAWNTAVDVLVCGRGTFSVTSTGRLFIKGTRSTLINRQNDFSIAGDYLLTVGADEYPSAVTQCLNPQSRYLDDCAFTAGNAARLIYTASNSRFYWLDWSGAENGTADKVFNKCRISCYVATNFDSQPVPRYNYNITFNDCLFGGPVVPTLPQTGGGVITFNRCVFPPTMSKTPPPGWVFNDCFWLKQLQPASSLAAGDHDYLPSGVGQQVAADLADLQTQINDLAAVTKLRGSVDTKADLPPAASEQEGDAFIVEEDGDYGGQTSIYVVADGAWAYLGKFTVDLSGVVKLQSATTQVIDSDLAMAVGRKFLGTAADGTQHELAGLNEYEGGQQVEVGSGAVPLCLNHRELPDWSDKHIAVNWQNIYGDESVDKLAYLSDLAPANGTYRFTADGKFQLLNSTTGKWHLLTVTGADGKAALAVSAGGED
jgi:hypothetical protein